LAFQLSSYKEQNKNILDEMGEKIRNTKDEIKKLRNRAEESLNRTSELRQVLAQIEATLSREENQKVNEKSQNK